MAMQKELDVLAICNVLKDIIIKVTDEELEELNISKGIMHLVSEEQQQVILEKFHNKEKIVEMGGSGPNMIRELAILGRKVSQTGMVGSDHYGDLYLSRVKELGIKNNISQSDLGSTGTSIILISPDGERTMNTCLGMSRCYTVNDVPDEDIKKSKYLIVTGYQWDTDNQIEAISHAIRVAKHNDTKIVFDIADPFCVDKHRETFMNVIEEYADIVFANHKELHMLTGKELDKSIKMLSPMLEMLVVKCGKEGSKIVTKDGIVHIPSNEVPVIDTTAAGDMYAGGFLFGLLNKLSLEESGKIATYCAETVIQYVGARLPNDLLKNVEKLVGRKFS
ncbi:MAG: adenosine kinase [Candidatus Sericytochromatia bacterium]